MTKHLTSLFPTLSSPAATFLFLMLCLLTPSLRAQDPFVPPTVGQHVLVRDSAKVDSLIKPSEHPAEPDAGLLPDSVFAVDSTIISGNEKTKDFVILRELSLRTGVMITSAAIRYDQQRIYSLGLFNDVRMWVSPTGTRKANVYIKVVERWYILPYPIFGMKEGKWSKAYFGAGLVHTNFRGRNEKLFVNFGLGYDPFGSISYRNPFLDEAGTKFIEGRVSYSRVRNRSALVLVHPGDVFDEKHLSVAMTFGKRYGNTQTAWISGEFHMVTVDDYIPPPTTSTTGTDRFPMLTIGYAYDSRDLFEYTGSGTLFSVSATKYGFPRSEIDYIRYSLDVRRYLPLGPRFTLAGRGYTNLLAGSRAPSYNRVYLGYQYHVRGYYAVVAEGENIFGTSAELRYALIPPFIYKSKLLPSQFGVWKFSVNLALFADLGTVWLRGNPITIANTLRGYGAGIHFGLPYGVLLRTDYAINDLRKGEFIIDVGAAL